MKPSNDALNANVDLGLPSDNWTERRVVVACSGGPDSTALVRLVADRLTDRSRLIVAHFNHKLRETASDRDEQFVISLCQRLNIESKVGQVGAVHRLEEARDGLEAAARQARYAYLIETAETCGARYLFTGHTADDQAETVLFHVLRGTGLAGLAGIPPIRSVNSAVSIVRPLIHCRHSALINYLELIGQPYCEDEHNQDDRFRRNLIRHQLLPWLEKNFHHSVHDSLRRLGVIAHEAQQTIRQAAEDLLETSLETTGAPLATLRIAPLQKTSEHLRREVFVVLWQKQQWPQQSMTFEHWHRLAGMLDITSTPQTLDFPAGVRAERSSDFLKLRRCHS